MTLRLPRADAGLALLLAAIVVVLIGAWPERADLANASWYPVAVVRTSGLLLWGWLAGTAMEPGRPARRASLTRLGVAVVATAPLEALAFVGSAPSASLVWTLLVPLPLAIGAYGGAWAMSAALRRVRLGWSLPLASPLVVAGLAWLDVQVGPPLWLPWLLPSSPSPAAAAVNLAVALVTVVAASGPWLRGRGTP
ncbi:MAG: hypothetical protein U5J97_07485 [Trueperaceae bacterium]|nr:hypothetical protein [Trueperaceae bacterium]